MDTVLRYPFGNKNITRVQNSGEAAYVKDGTLYVGQTVPCILISAETDLANLPALPPGTLAHTAGWQNAWELDVDGSTWVSLMGGDD